MAKISVFGTGYVGLIAGACFAKYNNHVVCVDIDEKKIALLKSGKSPIYEPGLEDLLDEVIARRSIEFTTDAEYAISNSLLHFLCVGTPRNPDGSADLRYVFEVAKTIGKYMKDYAIVVDKSTVPPGTARAVKATIEDVLRARGVDIPFDVVSNPEFLREGSSVHDFLYPDRVVIGIESERAGKIMYDLYEPFVRNGNPRHVLATPESAEIVKLYANAALATKIVLNNEIARLCEAIGADIRDVVKGVGSDSRIGPKFLHPGPGYGGSCFPKDTEDLVFVGRKYNCPISIVERTIGSNEEQKQWCAEKIGRHYSGSLEGKVFGVWGLAFKAETDDMRESPAIPIIDYLIKHGAKVKAYDREAMEKAKKIFGDKIEYCPAKEDVIKEVDALVVVTNWDDFMGLDLEGLLSTASQLKDKVIFDFRNLYPNYLKELKANGIRWYGVGITQ